MPGKLSSSPTSTSKASSEVPVRLDWATESASKAFRSHQPFPVARIANLVEETFLQRIEDELMDQMFFCKDNDLYSFLQSDDLSKVGEDYPAINALVSALYSTEFREALETLTGIQTNDSIDLTSSVYQRTNTLLCHDDELLGRRLAFILYLVPSEWTDADGGQLDLFSVNAHGEPDCVAKRILPSRNSFIVFEVSDKSFHQVAEVLSHEKRRLSIGGWFHGEPYARTKRVCPERILPMTEVKMVDVSAEACLTDTDRGTLSKWLRSEYLYSEQLQPIQEQMFEESCVELGEFLLPDVWALVKEALRTPSLQSRFVRVGPYNKRCFDVDDLSVLDNNMNAERPEILSELVDKLLLSDAFANFLRVITGGLLVLSRGVELRKYAAGDYSLAFDGDAEAKLPGLDVTLCLADNGELDDETADEKWHRQESGGALVYADEGEDEPLVQVAARANSLTIVYRSEPGTMSFVKYVTHAAPGIRYDLAMVCRVQEDDEEEGDEVEHCN